MTSLRLTLLGETRLELGGERLALPTKPLALLCYLAVARRRVSREALLELFWEAPSGEDASANLRVALSKLRKALGEHLEIEREAVALRPEAPLWLDSARFAELARSPGGEDAALEEAAALYRGEFMADFRVPDAPRFEEWQALERERLHQLALGCFAALSERALARGDQAAALEHALRLLALEPWREGAHRQLMRLYARRGEHAAAIRQYESCRAVLAAELDVAPSRATRALFERVLAARDRPQPPLPLPSAPLVGRERELEALLAQLAKPECRLLAIVGPGGVGKTRLALELARRQQNAFLEGVRWVPLANARGQGPLLDALAAGLDLTPSGGDLEAQVAAALAPKEALLVLDGFEQLLAEGSALLARLLEAAPEVRLLVTSRERLPLQRAWVLPLAGLEHPAPGAGALRAADCAAARLFRQSAERAGAALGQDAAEREAVLRICQLVGGLPLALELAGAGTWRSSAREIAAALERGLGELASDALDLPERHRSVRAVLEHAWGQLSATEARLMEALSVFAGGFGAELAAEVTGAGAALLEALQRKSLLQRAGARYDLHPLVHDFARARLGAEPERLAALRARHARALLEPTRNALRHFWSEDQASWLARLAAEQANLREALGWAREHDPAFGLGLAKRLWQFWLQWGQFAEGRAWLAAMLDATDPEAQRPERAEALNGAASLAFVQGDYPAARDLYRESLELSEAMGDEESVAIVLNNLANVLRTQGDLGAARAHYQRSLALREKLGLRRGVASSLSNLGLLAEREGDLAGARALYRQSLAIRRELGEAKGVAISLCNLGFVALKQGDAEAEGLLCESLSLQLELGGKAGVADCLRGLGNLESVRRPERAATLWGAAEALREAMGAQLEPAERADYERALAAARARLEPSVFGAARQRGREMDLETAARYALGSDT